MIGAPLDIDRVPRSLVEEILRFLLKYSLEVPMTVAIAGESGSGKSVLAHSVSSRAQDQGLRSIVLQQDDYFHYPPITNDRRRREDRSRVGLGEVDMGLMEQHIAEIRRGVSHITKPVVNYPLDFIGQEVVPVLGLDILIVEGTYVSILPGTHCSVFIDRTYLDTVEMRLRRGREVMDPFIESILEIEHQIIVAHLARAHLLVTPDDRLVPGPAKVQGLAD